MDKVSIFGVEIDNITLDDAVKEVESYLKGDELNVIITPNTEIVMAGKEDEKLKRLINSADMVIPDGIGLIYGSKIQKKPLKERVTGFDLSIKMLELADKQGYSLFLLGGADGVAKVAAERINKDYPNVKIAGYQHGFFKGSHLGIKDSKEEEEIVKKINESNPDIIFVGLGFPKQELWIDANKDRLSGKVIIGNGGVMDILSGNAKRAPEFFQKMGLEWFYRLVKEPSRIKRQIVLPKFMLKVIFDKDAVK